MSAQPPNNISWYANVYYSYRDYPIKHLNVKYKKSQLKTIYNTLIKKMFSNFEISIANIHGNDDPNDVQKKPLQDLINDIQPTGNQSDRNSEKTHSDPKDSEPGSQMSILQNNQQLQHLKAIKKQSHIEQNPRRMSIQSSQSSISEAPSVHRSRQNIEPMRSTVKHSESRFNDLQFFQIYGKTEDKNMDVLYELMIGMIRLTMKRITVEIDQQIKYVKEKQKKFEIIDEQLEKSSNDTESDKDSSFKSIRRNQSDMVNSQDSYNSSLDAGQSSNFKLLVSYSSKMADAKKKFLGDNSKIKDDKNGRKKMVDSLNREQSLTNFEYPSSLEELKFSFLKYCLTTNVSTNSNQMNKSQHKKSQEKNLLSQPQQPIFEVNSFKEVTSENQDSQSAKSHLNTYFTQFTEMDEQEILKTNPQNSISEMQSLVMKVADFQMNSFNLFVNHFFKKIQQASAIVNVIGLDAITDSMCQMALGKQARNNGIKTQVGLGNMQIKLFSNSVSQENSNILLSTWADLILFAEDPKTLYQITESLNTESKHQKQNKKKKAWTPSICSAPINVNDKRDTETETIQFREKLISLLNFLILNTSKNIFLESVTKANFLSLVIVEILANRQDRRGLREFELRPLKDSEMLNDKKNSNHFLHQNQAIIVYDLTFQKQVWMKESLDLIFTKWKKVIEIIFQEQIKNANLYWELVFEKCVTYINKHMSLLTVLVFNLVEIIQNLNLNIKFLIDNQKFNNQQTKRQLQDHEHMKRCIELMIKELVGCAKVFGIDETQTMGCNTESFRKGFTSTGTREFTDFQHGFKFINRQENAKQLIMWESITKENILILENYILNIELIMKLFSNKPLHTASWVVNFHKEAKILMKKVKNENLSMFFEKFYEKIPKLWQNLNAQENENFSSSHAKRMRGPNPRQRISSIKQKRELTAIEKQALIINYMIKAELELYESYTKSHLVNCRQEISTMTTIVSGNSTVKLNRPFIFDDANIEALLIFNFKYLAKSQNGMISNNLFAKRTQKVNLTLKPLSNFAPTPNLLTLSPRKPVQNSHIKPINEPFHKRNKSDAKTTSKQMQKFQVDEYEIDVSLLETVQYTRQEIELLKELNNHLKFINEINFEYEFYYWKNVALEKKFNLKSKENQPVEQENQPSADEQTSEQKDEEMKRQKPGLSLKKVVTYNEYVKQKTHKFLTTKQLYIELSEINKNLPGSRTEMSEWPKKFDTEADDRMRFSRRASIQESEKQHAKNLYKQKIQEFQERIKIHNDSLVLIVKAALEAKNYWKAVSTNVFPDDDILNGQKQEYIMRNQNKIQKVTDYEIQIDFQERFFEKKILQKLFEYINYYREISEQMNYCIDSGKIDADPGVQFDNESNPPAEDTGRMNKEKSADIKRKNKEDSVKGLDSDRKNNKNKLSIFGEVQTNKHQKIRVYSLLEALICKKQQPKMNRFEIAASIYRFSQKILRINCYMSSFYVERKIYLDIISNQEISEEKYMKVKIIGKEYFEKIKQLSVDIYEDKEIAEENLKNVELIYEKKVLIIMVSLLQLIYYGNEHTKTMVGKWKYDSSDIKSKKQRFNTVKDFNEKDFQRGYKNHGFKMRKTTMRKYSEMFKKYLKYRFKSNTSSIFQKEGLSNIYMSSDGDEESKSDYFYISKLLSEVFQFGETTEEFTEEKFIQNLRKLRTEQNDEEFLKFYIQIMEQETSYLEEFETEYEKVNCLKKKFNYLILREIYFFLYYDIDCLEEKSAYSKKNYELYENRILEFYQEIIAKSYEDFMTKKEMELKKRSVYLQNYLLKYEDEPQLAKVQKNLNKLLVCVFNQVMLIYTQDIKMEIKKKCEQVEALNHKMKKFALNPLHTQYLSAEFYEDKTLYKKKQEEPQGENPSSKQVKNGSSFTLNNSGRKHDDSGVSMQLFHNIFTGLINQQRESGMINLNSSHKYKLPNEKSYESIYSNQFCDSLTCRKKKTFKIFTVQSMNLHEAINIYQEIRHTNTEAVEKYLIRLRQSMKNTKSLKRNDLTEMEIKTLETNEESIVSLLKRQIIEKINQLKFELVQKNLISRIQKLYINLDVRHKVFESFKDKILSYEMQKAKIYHQYMDYIRGLKLDVYSHIANEESLPYIKILNAIKFYRLEIKKEELQNKVRQEFGKNLRKWNEGIQEDIANYNQWLDSEQKQWDNAKIAVDEQKNKFLLVYDSIKKEIKRQAKKRELEEKRANKNCVQIEKAHFVDTNLQSFKNIEKPSKQLKKMGISKKNMFLAQKQKQKTLEFNTLNTETNFRSSQTEALDKAKCVILTRGDDQKSPENIFAKVSIHNSRPITAQIGKSNSFHTLNHRSLSKHSAKMERPTTSIHSEFRLSCHTGAKGKRDMYRASTAVTRQKSIDLQTSQFRGIKMKFISKSFEKFMSCAESAINEGKNFKRSTDYSALQGDKQQSVNGNSKNRNITANPSNLNSVNESYLKSRTLLKQGRTINSAMPERKGIIKNF